MKDPKQLIIDAIEAKTNKKCKDIFEALNNIANETDGLIIFIDEMGKCLESVAKGIGDVYIFNN